MKIPKEKQGFFIFIMAIKIAFSPPFLQAKNEGYNDNKTAGVSPMVHRPGPQAPRPTHVAGQFTVAANLPPMRSIKNEGFKDGIRAKFTNAMVDQINALILAENMAATVKIENHSPGTGRALLHCSDDTFKAKIETLSAVKSIDPVALLYPMGNPGTRIRKPQP